MKFASSAFPSFVIRAGILFPATTGSTASDRSRIDRAVLDKAWNSINTNQFGTNEYMAWCKEVGTLPLMGLNLGTGTAEEAAALVEYCNVDKGTKWSELRRKHGIRAAVQREALVPGQ